MTVDPIFPCSLQKELSARDKGQNKAYRVNLVVWLIKSRPPEDMVYLLDIS